MIVWLFLPIVIIYLVSHLFEYLNAIFESGSKFANCRDICNNWAIFAITDSLMNCPVSSLSYSSPMPFYNVFVFVFVFVFQFVFVFVFLSPMLAGR